MICGYLLHCNKLCLFCVIYEKKGLKFYNLLGVFTMILNELFDAFLYSRKNGVNGAKCKASPFTMTLYSVNLGYFFAFMQEVRGRTKYEEITRTDVQEFVEYVNNNECWKSVATKLNILRVTRTLFKFVENDEECQEQKLRSWRHILPAIQRSPRRNKIPSTKELKSLRNDWNTGNIWGFRNYVMYCYMLGTGQRLGEVVYARLDYLKLEEGMVYVPEEGKTGWRLVPVDQSLLRILKMWIKKRAKIRGADESPFLFMARGGKQLTRSAVGQAFRRIQPDRKVGERITAHVLRHSFSTYYLRNGGNMEKLRLITGHKTYDMLKEYLHLAEVGSDQAKQELERVSPLKMLDSKD